MEKNKKEYKTSIGGQALIEGIMMRGPKKISIAVRQPDGDIKVDTETLETMAMKNKLFGLPLIRGVVGLVESMKIGMDALMYSAETYYGEDFEDDEIDEDGLFYKIFKDRAEDVQTGLMILSAVLLSIGLFMILPNLITTIFRDRVDSIMALNLIEGLVRIGVFIIYVLWVSSMEDIGGMFEYHGAEHKSIHCFEAREELTVENVKKYPILHARCGTSFLFMVMIISIFVLSFFGWPSPIKRVLTRIFMFPVIAGISYEVNRLIGKSDSRLCYYLSYPGLMIQKIATVKEPDDLQIEVAIAALKEVIPEDEDEAKW